MKASYIVFENLRHWVSQW